MASGKMLTGAGFSDKCELGVSGSAVIHGSVNTKTPTELKKFRYFSVFVHSCYTFDDIEAWLYKNNEMYQKVVVFLYFIGPTTETAQRRID